MEQETEPLLQSNEDDNNIKKKFNYKTYIVHFSKCICIIFVIVLIWLILCYGERNLSSRQQICKY